MLKCSPSFLPSLLFVCLSLPVSNGRSEEAASDTPAKTSPASKVEMVRGKNYAIVTTEEYDAYVLVDGESMFDEHERVDHEQLDWRTLGNQIAKRRKLDEGKLMVHILYRQGKSGMNLLNWAMVGFGDRKRFKKTHWTNSIGGGDFWDEINASVKAAEERGQGSEEPIGNQYVQIRPVRKFISCLKTDNANCIVKIVPQLVGSDRRLPGVIRASVLKYIKQVDAPAKDKLLFEINYHREAKPLIEWLGDEGLQEIADQLGYSEATGHFAEYDFLLKK